MTFTILAVCTANICRSPAIVATLAQRLAGTELNDELDLSSCGEHAWTKIAACDEIAGTDVFSADKAQLLAKHRPAQLTYDRVRRSDLILAADRSVRSAIVRIDPTSHDRAFTLREAAVLSSHVMTTRLVPTQSTTADAMRWLTSEMNDSRGLTRMPTVVRYRRTFLPWPRVAVHGHDVPDAHGAAPVPHQLVSELISSASDLIADSFTRSVRPGSDRRPAW